MDSTYVNSKNSKTSNPHVLILNLTDKIDLRRGEKNVVLSNLNIYYEITKDKITKITKDKNGKNVPHLEITEVVLVHCNTVSNYYQQDSRVLYTFLPNKSFGIF